MVIPIRCGWGVSTGNVTILEFLCALGFVSLLSLSLKCLMKLGLSLRSGPWTLLNLNRLVNSPGGTLARPSKTAALGDTQPSVTFARARSTVVTWAGGEPLSITGQEDTNRQCSAKSNARGARQ